MDPLFNTRMSVVGLRTSDPASLSVLTQDLLRQNLSDIAPGTLADLFALSEAGDVLPRPQLRDLQSFTRQKEREVRDLPDGKHLQGFLEDMASIEPSQVPASLRSVVENLQHVERLAQVTQEMLELLRSSWQEVEPAPLHLERRPAAVIHHPPTPKRLRTPTDEPSPRRRPRKGPASAPTSQPQAQNERESWIRQYVIERLDTHGDRGLKESILLATTCHQAPWNDMPKAEVLAVLRALKREGKVRNSAGRWSRPLRFGG